MDKKIKIELTPALFRELMQLVYLGRWMSAANHDDPETSVTEIEQVVYSRAKDCDLDELVDYDPSDNRFLASNLLEEEVEPIIQNYDDFTFWDQLAWQLAERDFSRKFDHAQILCMTSEETFREKNLIADKYFDEFSANGLENFKLTK
jgi:hypothetical protein